MRNSIEALRAAHVRDASPQYARWIWAIFLARLPTLAVSVILVALRHWVMALACIALYKVLQLVERTLRRRAGLPKRLALQPGEIYWWRVGFGVAGVAGLFVMAWAALGVAFGVLVAVIALTVGIRTLHRDRLAQRRGL